MNDTVKTRWLGLIFLIVALPFLTHGCTTPSMMGLSNLIFGIFLSLFGIIFLNAR